MAGELDNIQLGMSVEIKDAIQDITDFGRGAVKSVEEIRGELDKRFQPGDLTGPMIMNLGTGFDGLNVSINDLLERLDELRDKYKSVAIGSAAQQRLGREIGSLESVLAEQKDKLRDYGKVQGDVTNNTNRFGASLGKVSRYDLRTFASQLFYSAGETGKLGSQLSTLATGLLTGGFIGAAFAGFASLINLIGKGTEELGKKVKELIKVETAAGTFNLKPENIPAAIELLEKKLAEIELISTTSFAMKTAYSAETTSLKESIKVLKEARTEEENRLGIVNLFKAAGLTYTEELDKQGKAIKSIVIQFKTAQELWDSIQNGPRGSSPRDRYFASLKNRDEAAAITDEQINDIINEDIKALNEENVLLEDQVNFWDDIGLSAAQAGRSWIGAMTAGAQILRNNNSMLQQFINLLGKAVLEAFALKAALFFLNLFGGGGGPVSAVFGGPPSPASGGSGGGMFKPTYYPGSGNGRTFINTVVQPVAVTVYGRLEGRDIYLANRKAANYKTRFQ